MAYSSDISNSRQTALTRAIEKIGPAVASINIEQHVSSISFDPFFGFMFPREIYPMKSSGSGVVISPDGFVITNHHVVENADRVTVTLSGGDEYEAEMIGSDETSDLALLKLEGSGFPYAELGNSDDLLIGEWVIALGNPFELFTVSNKPSASVGIISATNMDFGMQKSGKVFQDMIQTDAAINPGNSGGPLVNSLGQVIGINTFIFRDYESNRGSVGIGFAIPINRALKIVKELRSKGKIVRGFNLGIRGQSLDSRTARLWKMKSNNGVIIAQIAPNSPADKAKLQYMDVILSVENENVSSLQDIYEIIAVLDLRPGDRISIKVWREGRIINRYLILDSL